MQQAFNNGSGANNGEAISYWAQADQLETPVEEIEQQQQNVWNQTEKFIPGLPFISQATAYLSV